jgi:hypothetical protein
MAAESLIAGREKGLVPTRSPVCPDRAVEEGVQPMPEVVGRIRWETDVL